MFTGLVEDVGTVLELQRRGPLCLVRIVCWRIDPAALGAGESVAVDGACLTVSERLPDGFRAEASPETLARTTLGGLRPGQRVHLERALRLGDRLGGHLVLGHVDGVGHVVRVEPRGAVRQLTISCPREVAGTLVYKGSVAVDGVSLTVNSLTEDLFTVSIIPHTSEATLLGEKHPGDPVNLEGDILGKYVLAALARGLVAGGVQGGPRTASDAGSRAAGAGAASSSDERLRQALAQAGIWGGEEQGGA